MVERIEKAKAATVHIERRDMPGLTTVQKQIQSQSQRICERLEWKAKHSRLPKEKRDALVKEIRERVATIGKDVHEAARKGKKNWEQMYIDRLDEIAKLVVDPKSGGIPQDYQIFNAWNDLHNIVWSGRNIGPLDMYSADEAKKIDTYLRKCLDEEFAQAPDELKKQYLEYLKKTFEQNLEVVRNAEGVTWHEFRDDDMRYMLGEMKKQEREKYEKEKRLHHKGKKLEKLLSYTEWFAADPENQSRIKEKRDVLDALIKRFRGTTVGKDYFFYIEIKFIDSWDKGIGAKKDTFTINDEQTIEALTDGFDSAARAYAKEQMAALEASYAEFELPDKKLPAVNEEGKDALDEVREVVEGVLRNAKTKIETPGEDVMTFGPVYSEATMFVEELYARALAHYNTLIVNQSYIKDMRDEGISEAVVHELEVERDRIAGQLVLEVSLNSGAREDLSGDITEFDMRVTVVILQQASYRKDEPNIDHIRGLYEGLLKKLQEGRYITPGTGEFNATLFKQEFDNIGGWEQFNALDNRKNWREKASGFEEEIRGYKDRGIDAAKIQAIETLLQDANEKVKKAAENLDDVDIDAAETTTERFENDFTALGDIVKIMDWEETLADVDEARLPTIQKPELEKLKTDLTAQKAKIDGETSGAHADHADKLEALKVRVEAFQPFIKTPIEETPPSPIVPPPTPTAKPQGGAAEPPSTTPPSTPEPPPGESHDETPATTEPKTRHHKATESREARIRAAGKELTKDKTKGPWTFVLQNQLKEKMGTDFTEDHEWPAILALEGETVKIKKPDDRIIEKKIEGNPFRAMAAIGEEMEEGDVVELPIDRLIEKAKKTVSEKGNREKVAKLWKERGKEGAEQEREKPKMSNRELWGLLTQGGTASSDIERDFLSHYELGQLQKPREELQQGPSKTPTVRLTLDWGIVDIRLQENGKLTATVADKNGDIVGDYVYTDMRSDTVEEFAKRLQEAKKELTGKPRTNEELWELISQTGGGGIASPGKGPHEIIMEILNRFVKPYDLGVMERHESLLQGDSRIVKFEFDWGMIEDIQLKDGKLVGVVKDKKGEIVERYAGASTPDEFGTYLKGMRDRLKGSSEDTREKPPEIPTEKL